MSSGQAGLMSHQGSSTVHAVKFLLSGSVELFVYV